MQVRKFLSNYICSIFSYELVADEGKWERKRERIRWHSWSQQQQERRGAWLLFAFEFSWKRELNQSPTSPGVLPPVNRQAYSRAVLSGMPNICFISWKKKKKKPRWFFPPSPLLRALWKGESQPPVHFQHSRGERQALGVMGWGNGIPQSHSINAKREKCCWCTCV